MLFAGGVYAEKPINPYFEEKQENSTWLECGSATNPLWVLIGNNSESGSVWYFNKPMNRKEMKVSNFNEYAITFKDVHKNHVMTLNRMNGKLTDWGDCTQYSMDEFNDRKQKFYDSIVKERKF